MNLKTPIYASLIVLNSVFCSYANVVRLGEHKPATIKPIAPHHLRAVQGFLRDTDIGRALVAQNGHFSPVLKLDAGSWNQRQSFGPAMSSWISSALLEEPAEGAGAGIEIYKMDEVKALRAVCDYFGKKATSPLLTHAHKIAAYLENQGNTREGNTDAVASRVLAIESAVASGNSAEAKRRMRALKAFAIKSGNPATKERAVRSIIVIASKAPRESYLYNKAIYTAARIAVASGNAQVIRSSMVFFALLEASRPGLLDSSGAGSMIWLLGHGKIQQQWRLFRTRSGLVLWRGMDFVAPLFDNRVAQFFLRHLNG